MLTIENKKYINIKTIPPPLGLLMMWELLSFGLSNKYFLKNFIDDLSKTYDNKKEIVIISGLVI